MIGAELGGEPPRAPLISPRRDGPMIPGCWVTGWLTHRASPRSLIIALKVQLSLLNVEKSN